MQFKKNKFWCNIVKLDAYKKLFCAFIDLKQAFDKEWRNGLWEKLADYDINSKCLRKLKKIYENLKSCVIVIGTKTNSLLVISVLDEAKISHHCFLIYF